MKYCPLCGSVLVTRVVDNRDRLACADNSCGFVFWNNPVPVVAALIRYRGNYVLARNAAWPTGIFSLVTGFLEQNETLEQAVVREIHEELGLQGQVQRHIGNYVFKEKNQLILCYEAEGFGEIALGPELAEVKQVSPDDLARYDFRPLYITQKVIEDWIALGARKT